MRPLTSGVFQRLMAEAFPEIDTVSRTALDVGRLLLNYVLSDPYVDMALLGGHGTCLSEPQSVELQNKTSDDVASQIDLARLRNRYIRGGECRDPHTAESACAHGSIVGRELGGDTAS